MELSAHTFKELADAIRLESGIMLGPDKAYLVRHRLEPLVRSEALPGFDDLVRQLRTRSGNALRNAVVDAITVKETRFFRDQAFFDVLQKSVLPTCASALAAPGHGRQRIRIWSAAASTGQEAYSVAMLVRELSSERDAEALDEKRVTILASDISAAAIEAARAGQYSAADVHRGVSDARLRQHFRHTGHHWSVDESLRRLMQFRTFNLLNSPANLGAFDVILCRNVMIYFDDAFRRRICRALYSVLHEGGWLALGSAESLYGMEDQFETHVIGKTIIYRKPYRV
jgi:chemotaxis protein methyltransferase CheR